MCDNIVANFNNFFFHFCLILKLVHLFLYSLASLFCSINTMYLTYIRLRSHVNKFLSFISHSQIPVRFMYAVPRTVTN